MAFREELEKQGKWFFRWRSYLPLFVLPFMLIALRNSEYLEDNFGNSIDGIYEGLCLTLSFVGLTIRCLTIGYIQRGTSGRNTKGQKAERLNTTGMYSLVRHPLYLGNFFIFLGITSFLQVWWLILIAVLAFFIYYERILFAEEEFLRHKFGEFYLRWASRTPAFFPRIRSWQPPSQPFSARAVIGREYSSFFAIIATFTFLELAGEWAAESKLELDVSWIVFFLSGLIIYIVLRILKKKTRILHVVER
jgi:protein-S-isoprenylcysteine O-methyltransferase Ste14